MSKPGVVVALDQGTSSTKAVAVDETGAIIASHVVPVAQHVPQPGWVEQDPEELLVSLVTAAERLVVDLPGPVVSVGLSNQRESALVWETRTGKPLGPVLGWQDRRTRDHARYLETLAGPRIRELSGLPVDPMFSALKFARLLDEVDPDRSQARNGDITVGTLDAWLVQRLTGERRIELGNASRTQLLNVRTGGWDDELMDIFGIPPASLPDPVPSDLPTAPVEHHGALDGLRIGAVLGDSHAALFAHGVRGEGRVKATYGTGSSVMGLSSGPVSPDTGLVETIAWQHRGEIVRAFEGNILSTGATLQWLAGVLGCSTAELAELAASTPDSGEVVLVPAFAGLGAPWWDETARSVITGFGLGTRRQHLARAAFESIALQVEDVLERADAVSSERVHTVLADGGPTRNDWLVQLQADLSDRQVLRADATALSVTGAAHLAGLASGLWDELAVQQLPRQRTTFSPSAVPGTPHVHRQWRAAVRRARAAV
ncbi:FGGY-family carbohydrate kinase [Kineococcus sp. SYSU DK004]|uniref:FGGY-family carbohydrate kinase n=1 Tax=Kineococcus sp. SYSU DK004 TaxID=3383125 RepID=UPI003D7E9E6D